MPVPISTSTPQPGHLRLGSTLESGAERVYEPEDQHGCSKILFSKNEEEVRQEVKEDREERVDLGGVKG